MVRMNENEYVNKSAHELSCKVKFERKTTSKVLKQSR